MVVLKCDKFVEYIKDVLSSLPVCTYYVVITCHNNISTVININTTAHPFRDYKYQTKAMLSVLVSVLDFGKITNRFVGNHSNMILFNTCRPRVEKPFSGAIQFTESLPITLQMTFSFYTNCAQNIFGSID